MIKYETESDASTQPRRWPDDAPGVDHLRRGTVKPSDGCGRTQDETEGRDSRAQGRDSGAQGAQGAQGNRDAILIRDSRVRDMG